MLIETIVLTATLLAADVGPGNAAAAAIANHSPLVQASFQLLLRQAQRIHDPAIRLPTDDALHNPETCIASRANLSDAQKDVILDKLAAEGLAPSKNKDGVFPPVINDGGKCPHLPMLWYAAPGSVFDGHHSYPGGLPIHESFNSTNAMNLMNAYHSIYGSDTIIRQDLLLAAPLWHDWAKAIVFQWNADGTEFPEYNFGGGNDMTDAWGAAGDSRTGAHHILSLAEMMARKLPVELIITTASAHATPANGNEYKVVNWLRAAAILARVDPLTYLTRDEQGRLRLPALRKLNLIAGPDSLQHSNLLPEYAIHNLSDADFVFTGPAITEMNGILAGLAPKFGFQPTDYNGFRNKVLANFSAERLLLIYANSGVDGVSKEISKIKGKFVREK